MNNRNRKVVYRKKKKVKRPSKILVVFRIIFLITVITLAFSGGRYIFNLSSDLIKIDSIREYIEVTDKVSENNKQLNWKEVASIYGAKKDSDINDVKDDIVSEIANSFYNNGKVINFKDAISKNNLSAREEKKAYKIFKKLEYVSIRRKLDGGNEVKDEFIASLIEPSKNVYKKYGILPSVLISQAILESDWGRSDLASKYKNYFGIKADESWTGNKIKMKTKENHNDVIKDYFRVYDSIEESMDDFGKFLNENSRYRNNGVFSAKSYIEQAQSLENAGYSTVKNERGEKIYADLLIDVIRENNLMIIDSEL